MPKRIRKDDAKIKRMKYQARIKKAYAGGIRRSSCWHNPEQCENPGYGIKYKIKGHIFTMSVDLSMRGKLSKSEKSYTLATSIGPYRLSDYNHPEHFIILNVGRAVPVEQRNDIEGMNKLVEAEREMENDDD